ncbi:MAG: glycosyltransferase family 4 protein [Bacteroidia bacterium]|nr:glycosyltransferase family 4 protein [Bacteroidia bacterium]
MKVLVLSNSISGLFSFRKEVFQEFRNLGWEVVISSPIENDNGIADWFTSIGCELIDTTFERQGMNPLADFKLMLYYRKLIKRVKADVVLSYTIKPNLYGGVAAWLCGVPQFANITGLGAAVEYPGMLQKITILLYKICMRRTRLVFFQNNDNLQFCLKHKMVRGRTKLIPGSGVNVEYHQQQPYPAENEPVRFLFCSRIRKEKGIEEFLAAAEYIHKRYPNTEFHLLGRCEGDYQEKIKQLAEQGIVTYHGRLPDVRPFYAQASMTILPSYYPEGMNNVLLESSATGRPIMTCDRPGCREIVDDGLTGYIVRQQDAQDVISKVEAFLALPHAERIKMGNAARHKVEQEFDRRKVVKAYVDEIKSIQVYYFYY